MIDKSKTPAPGCIDAAWCLLDCTECWRQYEERVKKQNEEQANEP